ncbi:glutamate--tRNA ligase [Rickettsiales endosymbiont of Peranema trichophorum]|uniref:glutamate--tRNA ligase n=1 Tax=Rickettsiales endosymbiont of Peranema trichophorum TaxID=2486577 RepID=UPI001022AFDE|nr:glutamate--tRNA ligase [Rickettsiales endosymbiont of Peranema trichophorum]RZI45995.1 glutamate--tRNA ligase [Rickettsiales endosymbiont of Peranema trichophorum]
MNKKQVITRFAPSPTGFLHIGGARTALFNWLFARHEDGLFYLRIEDTDKVRSTSAAKNAIIEGMKWLELYWNKCPVASSNDGIVYQSEREGRHREIAEMLVAKGNAYYCYASLEEIEAFRALYPNRRFESEWRDKNADKNYKGLKSTVRLKVSREGVTTVKDVVRGTVEVSNAELDDMIMLRADGTPTYMLAVVVDDFDMGVTHVIRGDDHFTNTFRQYQIIQAMNWPVPEYAHIPLIHGDDGKKLSKRHGALGIEAYVEMGYLPEALCNYLLRLGWSHGDEEILSRSQATSLFTLKGLGASSSRFDIKKLNYLNAHYMSHLDDVALVQLVAPTLVTWAQSYGKDESYVKSMLLKAMPQLKVRAETLNDILEGSRVYITPKHEIDANVDGILKAFDDEMAWRLFKVLEQVEDWSTDVLTATCNAFSSETNCKSAGIMKFLRAGVLGTSVSAPILDVLVVLGKQETLSRLSSCLKRKTVNFL